MTEIKLDSEAARSTALNLKKASQGFDSPQCDCFDNRDSQSKMMDSFEKHVKDVRELITQYQNLLTNDVDKLERSCRNLATQDQNRAAMLRGFKAASNSSNNGDGGGSR